MAGKTDRNDLEWLLPIAAMVALIAATEAILRYHSGNPDLPPYLKYSIVALVVSLAWSVIAFLLFMRGRTLGRALREIPTARGSIATFVAGYLVLAWMMAGLTGIKSMMSHYAPFWADIPLADLEFAIVGTDPWRITHALFGPATRAIDLVYTFWLPIDLILCTALLAMKPSRLKSLALVSKVAIWAIGVAAAFAFSSAGPVFYEQVTGDPRFAGLVGALRADPGLIAPGVADYLWENYANAEIAFGSGISAMPSMHVAVAVWAALVCFGINRYLGIAGWVYATIVLIGSVHLAWHYALDGILSGAAAVIIWKLIGAWLDTRQKSLSPMTNILVPQ